ncbi:MAG: GLUG motif-containing protein [Dehalococcoidia bacterium]
MKTLATFVITVALIVGLAGCAPGPVQYTLTISVTEGGEIVAPGEATSIYDEGTAVTLVVFPHTGYRFVNWTGDVSSMADVNAASTTITMNGDYSITAEFAAKQYDLTISSTEGGEVATLGEGTHTYDEGKVVDLVAEAEEGYQFVNWTGDVGTIADVDAASTTVTMNSDCTVTANFAKEIYDWYDLDAIRDNLGGSYILVNNLDSTTAGYVELASTTANGGRGWEPIQALESHASAGAFAGAFEGRGYEIRDLFINRPEEDGVGLLGSIGGGGVIENLGVVNAEVTGYSHVGGLVGWIGWSGGTVSNSYSTGSVTGIRYSTGGLVGENDGTVSNSYSTVSVTGEEDVGGLVGCNMLGWNHKGTVSNSYSTGSVTGGGGVGGLVGENAGTVSNSYSTGWVVGYSTVGGLVGCMSWNGGTVSNSHYNYDEVLINGGHIITIGALFNKDFKQWLANDKFLDVNEGLAQEDGYYLINDVSEFKELLAFGQNPLLKFRLKKDLNLGDETGFYIPYLAGEFDGNGHKIWNLSFYSDFITQVGLFGYLASGGAVTGVSAENVAITGEGFVGGLVGQSAGTVSNSYSTGRVVGYWSVGGLVGWMSWNGGTVSNSHYNYDEVLINGGHIITIGALFNEDFEQWLANDKFLDVNERLAQEDGYYLINDVSDFKQLLAFGQDGSLKFRLKNDLDLAIQFNFYIPYFAGEFDGNGRKISNLRLGFDSVAQVGLFGYLASGAEISELGVENVNLAVTGNQHFGGLVGGNVGTVSNSYCSGSVTSGYGSSGVGGLVGWNSGTVSNSYSTSSVTGEGFTFIGGLVGLNWGIVSNSFWDTETSGQATSDGGTGKTTAEMKSITTFSSTGWNIVTVASPDIRNSSYIWNIVAGQTYPFLSWEI